MSYSIDANLLIHAVNTEAQEHEAAFEFIASARKRPTKALLLYPEWQLVKVWS